MTESQIINAQQRAISRLERALLKERALMQKALDWLDKGQPPVAESLLRDHLKAVGVNRG